MRRLKRVARGGVAAEACCGRVPTGACCCVGGSPGWEDLPFGEPESLVMSQYPSSLHPQVPFLVPPHRPVSVPFSSSLNCCGSSFLTL